MGTAGEWEHASQPQQALATSALFHSICTGTVRCRSCYLPCCARMTASSLGSIFDSSMPGGSTVTPHAGPGAGPAGRAKRAAGVGMAGHGRAAARVQHACNSCLMPRHGTTGGLPGPAAPPANPRASACIPAPLHMSSRCGPPASTHCPSWPHLGLTAAGTTRRAAPGPGCGWGPAPGLGRGAGAHRGAPSRPSAGVHGSPEPSAAAAGAY